MRDAAPRISPVAVLLIPLVLGSGAAQAQWTYLNLHPEGASRSTGTAVTNGQQVGAALWLSGPLAGHERPILWTGSAASWVDLSPGLENSWTSGVHGGQQVGTTEIGDLPHASLWSGSAASWIDLTPPGATRSVANDVHDGVQVGSAQVGSPDNHAGMWRGTPESWVELHPTGVRWSSVYATDGAQQVGVVKADLESSWHASLWSGTAASWVDLHPVGADWSTAHDVHSGQQVGYVQFGLDSHASLWSGSAASWVDLHPAGAETSSASGVHSGFQVGSVRMDPAPFGKSKASLWSGSAESWVDLSLVLGAEWGGSHATGIWVNETTIYVIGSAHNLARQRSEAILWMRPLAPACAADCDESGQLDFFDFLCFQSLFAAGDPMADCDGSGDLSFFDFLCFQYVFAVGCP